MRAEDLDRIDRLLGDVAHSAKPLLAERDRLVADLRRIDRVLNALGVDPSLGTRIVPEPTRKRMAASARLRKRIGYDPSPVDAAICAALEGHTVRHRREIFARAKRLVTGVSDSRLSNHLYTLKQRGIIQSVGEYRRGFYRLIPTESTPAPEPDTNGSHIGELTRSELPVPTEARDVAAPLPAHLLDDVPEPTDPIAWSWKHTRERASDPPEEEEPDKVINE